MLEIDRQLVVLNRTHRAVAEFLVEHPVADGKAADLLDLLVALRHPGAFDEERPALITGVARRFPRRAPAWRRAGPTAAGIAAPDRRGAEPHLGHHLDLCRRQFVDKARARGALPLAVNAPVGGKRDKHPMPRPGQSDIGEAAL